MNQFEARIRDYLAENLNAIEPGLFLIQKEFPLPNRMGAGGSIDILAKDNFGHYVVIEIKRSNQAARAALHELTKYVALLKASLGIRGEMIRALLVSTEWHELNVPFDEYQRACEVPTSGYFIVAAEDGTVTDIKKYVPPVLEQPLNISRQQHVFLYKDAPRRDALIINVISAAKRALLKDFAILSVNYEGVDRAVLFPYGSYLIFSSPIAGAPAAVAEEIKSSLEWDDDLDDQDENFLVALMDAIEYEHDTSEIGYPEKLAQIISANWKISVAHRSGRYADNTLLLSDDQLISEAKKEQGGANSYIDRTVSPRYIPSWNKFKEDAKLVLLGNSVWSDIFDQVVGYIEVSKTNATVSSHIYNPANIVFSLAKLFGEKNPRFIPDFQLVETYEDEVILFLGAVMWDGEKTLLQGMPWIEKAYGSLDEYMMMQHFGEQFEKDDYACNLLGLSSVVLQITMPGTDSEQVTVLSIENGEISRTPFSKSSMKMLQDFYSQNQNFGASLVNSVRSFASGWIN